MIIVHFIFLLLHIIFFEKRSVFYILLILFTTDNSSDSNFNSLKRREELKNDNIAIGCKYIKVKHFVFFTFF